MYGKNGIRQVIQMHPKDNVLVALTDLEKDTIVEYENQQYILQDRIKAKHKFYIEDLTIGAEILMYGVLIGKVQTNVKRGSLMTTENLKHAAEPYSYRGVCYHWQAPDVSKYSNTSFN
ncbi:MAG: UxaA family hydrolase, partial [Sediminibacterium sp.]|nr:UxaA family hydrolase [Sediminibacterium sp.]